VLSLSRGRGTAQYPHAFERFSEIPLDVLVVPGRDLGPRSDDQRGSCFDLSLHPSEDFPEDPLGPVPFHRVSGTPSNNQSQASLPVFAAVRVDNESGRLPPAPLTNNFPYLASAS